MITSGVLFELCTLLSIILADFSGGSDNFLSLWASANRNDVKLEYTSRISNTQAERGDELRGKKEGEGRMERRLREGERATVMIRMKEKPEARPKQPAVRGGGQVGVAVLVAEKTAMAK